MPTYEYACEACGKSFELEQRITEAPVKKCQRCGKMKARRMISGGSFMLKGGGWYADGYSGKSNSKGDAGAGGAASSDGGSAASGATGSAASTSSASKTDSKPAAAD